MKNAYDFIKENTYNNLNFSINKKVKDTSNSMNGREDRQRKIDSET